MNSQSHLDTLIGHCLIADTFNFFSLFHQICFEVNQNHFQSIKEQAVLYNKLFDVFPLLLKQTTALLNIDSTQRVSDILISTLRFIRTLPLDSIVLDITSDILHEIICFCVEKVDSLEQLNNLIESLKPFFPPNYSQQIAILYLKKYIPQLPQFIVSTSIIPQFFDFQQICYSNKLLANYCSSKIIDLFKFEQRQNSKVFLISLVNSLKNISIIDGSLQLSRVCLEVASKLFQIIDLPDFLDFLQQDNIHLLCFYSECWEHCCSPTFEVLQPNYVGKIPIQVIKAIANYFGEELLIEYENRLATQLLHSGANELQKLNETYQFFQKNIFGDDCPGQVMFKDIQNSLKEMEKANIFKTLVISPAYWPELNSVKYMDLEEIREWKKCYIHKFQSNHPNQLLSYKQEGVVKLNYKNLKGITTYHVVTPLQATVLISIAKEENGILLDELEHKLGINETIASKIVGYWLDKHVISASDYMGSILLHKE